MNDDELGGAIASSVARRVDAINGRPDEERLLRGIERRGARQRRLFVASAALLLVVGATGGYLVGHAGEPEPQIVAVNDGVPGTGLDAPTIEPADAELAVAQIDAAFHAVFDGSTPDTERKAAVQGGDLLEGARREVLENAERRGYAPAATTIEVLDTSFVDPTHAVVRFTLSIPDHGPVLVDQIGYAVREDGRWKVALRTQCDLLSLGGLGQSCPPTR